MDLCPCLVWGHCLKTLSTTPGTPDPLAVARKIGGNEENGEGKGERTRRKANKRRERKSKDTNG